MEWTVHQLAERAGISGRTLRHYHRIGLLEPDRVGTNGYRFYGPTAVARLQRILLLRETGMPLAAIIDLLGDSHDPGAEIAALEIHREQLTQERAGLDRRIAAVEHTLMMRREGRQPRMDVMLDGFNDAYEEEVVDRWGAAAYKAANQWWHSKSVDQQLSWKRDADDLLGRWRELHDAGYAPNSPQSQEHAARHLAWFAAIPGTPTHAGDRETSAAMVRGVAEQYESNAEFHVAFGSSGAAHLAAAALRVHLTEHP